MDKGGHSGPVFTAEQLSAIRKLAETALQHVNQERLAAATLSFPEWIGPLCDALTSDAEADHLDVMERMRSSPVPEAELRRYVLPAAARELGNRWVRNRIDDEQVSLAAARLQLLSGEDDVT